MEAISSDLKYLSILFPVCVCFSGATVVLKVVSWSLLCLPEVLARFCLHINDYPLSLGRTTRKG